MLGPSHTHTHTHTHIDTHRHIDTHSAHTKTHRHTDMDRHTHMDIHTDMCAYTRPHTQTHTNTHAYRRTREHTHTHLPLQCFLQLNQMRCENVCFLFARPCALAWCDGGHVMCGWPLDAEIRWRLSLYCFCFSGDNTTCPRIPCERLLFSLPRPCCCPPLVGWVPSSDRTVSSDWALSRTG